jgi:hypothetical protein
MGFNKILAVLLILALLLTVLRKFFWILLGLFVLIIIIRLIADLYWFLKDKGKI